MPDRPIRAVFWDFGGVFTDSPFEAFARYEAELGLPAGLIRGINARDPDANAWARFERSEIDTPAFCRLFEAEARAIGHALEGTRVLACLEGGVRPEMVAALRNVRGRYRTACLTNNMRGPRGDAARRAAIAEVMGLFDAVVESSRAGVRKPERRFYEIACEAVGVAPEEVVFLDDLGINLKTARAMGMRTIKVEAAAQALDALEAVLGHPVR